MPDIRTDIEWFDDNVELYVDGELSTSDMQAFEEQLEQDARLRSHVDAAIAIKQSLGMLEISELPESVLDSVNAEIANSRQPNVLSLFSSSHKSPAPRLRRIVMSTVAAAASIILLFIVISDVPTGVSNADPTQAEVDAALLEVKRTLALVSEMGYERDDIVNGHVVDPVQKAMSYIFITETESDVQ